MTGSTISSISAAITAPPHSTEPPGPRPFRPGPRSPAWPLGHRPSCDRPSCALSRPEPIKLTVPLRMRGQPLNERPGQGTVPHVGQSLGIDHVLAVASAQEFQEVQPAFAGRGPKPGEVGVADLRAGAVRGLVAGPGVIDRDPGRLRQPGAQHVASLIEKALVA